MSFWRNKEEAEKQEEKEFFDSLRNPPGLEENANYNSLLDMKPEREKYVKFDDNTVFKDSLNDRDLDYHGGKRLNKSQEREDLSQIQLTNQDFAKYQANRLKRSHSSTKEYKITVPRTFKFEKRAELRPKSIREWKLEKMIEEKRLEDQLLNKHFKASRPPPEVLIPQYKNMIEKEKNRRKEVKEKSKQITKAKEKLFEFYKREERKKQLKEQIKKEEKEQKYTFKAKNVPAECTTEKMLDPKAEKAQRERRIKERAQKLYEESKMPQNMKKNEEKMNKRKEERIKALEKELFEFDRRPKRRDKPDFDKLHKDFDGQMEKKKKEFVPSKVIPFNLTEQKERNDTFEETKDQPNVFLKMLAGNIMKDSKKPVPVPTTKKLVDIIDKKKNDEMEEKAKKDELKAKEEEKKKKTFELKTIVQAKIAMEDRTQEKKKERKEYLEKKKLDNKLNELKQQKNIEEIIQKGQDRTLQIDGYESKSDMNNKLLN